MLSATGVGFRSEADAQPETPAKDATTAPDPHADSEAAATPWKSRAPSAFEEHMRSGDPEKTFFLTEQRSPELGGDLADVVSKELEDLEATLGEVEGDSQFPESDDLQVRDDAFHRSPVDRPTTLNALSAFCVALILLLPIVAVCGLWVGQASADSQTQTKAKKNTPHTYIEHLGATAHQGVQRLLGKK